MITYMRTDSVNIAREAQDAARDFISSEYGSEYIPEKPNFFKTKGNAQAAHEAIRPTDISRTPKVMARYLDKDQLRLYSLIWKRFAASQMSQALFQQETIEIDASGESCTHKYLFRTTATRNIFPGYLKVYSFKEEGEEEDEESTLPPLKKGEKCNQDEFLLKQHFTEPPPRFSEATLIKELEANGVGRPSTYAATVRTIQDREYVLKDKGRLTPSKIGMETCGYLTSCIPTLFEVKFTAGMEDKLDEIENGKMTWTDMLATFYSNFSTWMSAAKTAGAPPKGHYEALTALFAEDFAYDEPEKRGKRTYSDEKYVTSLVKNIADEKELTAKQWSGLLRICAKCQDRIPGLAKLAEELKFEDQLQEEVDAHNARLAARENPDTAALELIAILDGVTFGEAKKVGKRTYDDNLFRESLKEQALSGKILSENQTNALKKIIFKYNKQIENYDKIAEENGLICKSENEEQNKEIVALLALFDDITEWNEPTKRGRFTYDDKEFVNSLRTQFEEKGALSERQVKACKKTVLKYKAQISNFESRAKALELAEPQEDTGVKCPECGKPILKRVSRGRTFFGCSGFPKCKYLTNDLESIK